MHKTIYTCDRCGATQETHEQFWTVGVTIEHFRDANASLREPKAEWCRKCVDAVGLLGPKRTAPPPAPQPPTIEDVLREIVREEIEQAR